MELILKITEPAEVQRFATLLAGFSSPAATAKPEAVKPTHTQASAPAAAPDAIVSASAQPTAVETASTITLEQLRQVVAAKAKEDGGEKRSQVKALLGEFGASGVSALGAEHYVSFMEKVNAL